MSNILGYIYPMTFVKNQEFFFSFFNLILGKETSNTIIKGYNYSAQTQTSFLTLTHSSNCHSHVLNIQTQKQRDVSAKELEQNIVHIFLSIQGPFQRMLQPTPEISGRNDVMLGSFTHFSVLDLVTEIRDGQKNFSYKKSNELNQN